MNSDILLLIISLIGFGLIIYILYYLSGKVKDTSNFESNHNIQQQQQQQTNHHRPQQNIGGGLRHRRQQENDDNDNDDEDNEDNVDHTTKKDILKHEKVKINNHYQTN